MKDRRRYVPVPDGYIPVRYWLLGGMIDIYDALQAVRRRMLRD